MMPPTSYDSSPSRTLKLAVFLSVVLGVIGPLVVLASQIWPAKRLLVVPSISLLLVYTSFFFALLVGIYSFWLPVAQYGWKGRRRQRPWQGIRLLAIPCVLGGGTALLCTLRFGTAGSANDTSLFGFFACANAILLAMVFVQKS